MKTTISRTWCGQPIDAREHVRVEVNLTEHVEVIIDAPYHGDAPPDAPPGQLWGLWNFEVVEVFLLGDQEQYLEIEVGPHGHHLVLSIEGVREVRARHLPTAVEINRVGDRWRGRVEMSLELVPRGLRAYNAYAIHGRGEARRYLAAHPVPGQAPDFHQLSSFAPWPED